MWTRSVWPRGLCFTIQLFWCNFTSINKNKCNTVINLFQKCFDSKMVNNPKWFHVSIGLPQSGFCLFSASFIYFINYLKTNKNWCLVCFVITHATVPTHSHYCDALMEETLWTKFPLFSENLICRPIFLVISSNRFETSYLVYVFKIEKVSKKCLWHVSQFLWLVQLTLIE